MRRMFSPIYLPLMKPVREFSIILDMYFLFYLKLFLLLFYSQCLIMLEVASCLSCIGHYSFWEARKLNLAFA